ncbi:hypothetical protein [Amphritea pacifica]|uniref:hypothetical protein n=1 Tax=Amphritea pacifica TaxID=2811233 RepID=UPI001963FDD5|nr:hypothetical protein [Amphritea pacifica]MBN1005651.1 hypothetical protein [Amphritea pacifica]
MINKLICLVILVISLAGCAATYVQPVDGPTATLLIPKYSREFSLASIISGGDIMVARKEKDGCGNFEVIEISDTDDERIPISVKVGQDIFISIDRYDGNRSCNVIAAFMPEAGVSYDVKSSFTDKWCRVRIINRDSTNMDRRVGLKKGYTSSLDGFRVCDSKDKL